MTIDQTPPTTDLWRGGPEWDHERHAAAALAPPPADQCLCDFSFVRPRPEQVRTGGVITYLSRDLRKVATKAETHAWLDHGLTVSPVKQDGKTDALEGFQGGKARAEEANRQADERGYPGDVPIPYVAQDSGLTADQFPVVGEFFRGILSVRSGRPVGRYGGGNVFRYLDYVLGPVFALSWLAAATSWGDYAAAHLRQMPGAPWYPIPGCPTDDDLILRPFARWGAVSLSAGDRAAAASLTDHSTATARLLG